MPWRLSHRADPGALAIADRHYTPRTEGREQFVRPSADVVLRSTIGRAVWVTVRQRVVRHAYPGAWECVLFRNEQPHALRSSAAILAALAATRWEWGDPPPAGVLTFVTPGVLRSRLFGRPPGYCFRAVGFEERQTVPAGHGRPERVALVLPAELVPAAAPAVGATLRLGAA